MKSEELKEKDKLYQYLEFSIDKIKRKKTTYVWIYRASRILVFVSGTIITVLTGWKKYRSSYFDPTNTILVIGAVVSLFGLTEGLFDLKDKSMNYDVLLFDLRELRTEMCYDFYKNEKSFHENKDLYFFKLNEILKSQKSIIVGAYSE